MTKNPFINALSAEFYIVLVVSVIFFAEDFMEVPETMLLPVAMLSLFVLSAAMMGYIFLLAPLSLYLDGEKKQGVQLFLSTLGIFAAISTLILSALFIGISF